MRTVPIHILHIEDSELDAQLVRHALEKAQFQFELDWVDNFAAFKSALPSHQYDLILADYSLPDCDGLDIVRLVQQEKPFVPLLLVTGALGEERAIETIRAGVTDYILKTNLVRLRTSIPRALEEADSKREKQVAFEALQKSEERFDLAVRGSGAGIWDWEDVSQKRMWWSPRIYEMLGYAEGEIPATREQLYKLMSAEDAVFVQAEMQAHFNEGKPYDTEFRVRNKQGAWIWLRSRGQAIMVDGKPTRMAGYIQDVTDRKRAQETLRARQRDLLQAQEVANIGCWSYDIPHDHLIWTPTVYRIFGFSAREFKGSKAETLQRVHPDDLELVEKHWQHGLKYGRVDYEHRLLVDGQVRWVREVAEIEFDEDRRPLKALGVVHDLTSQRQAEEERRKADERYRVITNSAHDAIVVINLQGEVIFWNPAAERMTGYAAEEIIGQLAHDILFPQQDEPGNCLCHFLKRVAGTEQAGYSESAELTMWNKSGEPVFVDMNSNAIYQDEQWYGLGVIRDISERKKAEDERRILEAQLGQAQKMEAIGTLAGGIAHDFNNILASILGYATMASRRLNAGSQEQRDLEEVLKAAERAKQLVRQILTFSREGEVEKEPVPLDLVIKEVLQLIRASLPATIEVKVTLDAEGESVLGNSTQIHQVLMNLCTNAYHAMPDGGTLTIDLRKTVLDAALPTPLEPGNYLQLQVVDTGCGIPQDIVERIFDPYFTTKDVDTGTGLGLSVVHGIITSLDGLIEVDSTEGQGTCFRILLPCYQSEQQEPFSQQDSPSMQGSERILLIDDETNLAQLGKNFLASLGYRVTVQTSSPAALREVTAAPDAYDLVITDQAMPEITGIELAKRLKQVAPELPVILISGLQYSLETKGISDTGICRVVMKTDMIDSLPGILRELFDCEGE